MRSCALVLLLLVASAAGARERPPTDGTEGPRPFVQLESRNYSEPVSVLEAYDLLEADGFEGGDTAFSHSEAEFGLRWRRASVSVVYRQDWFLRFSEDLAELAFRQVNDRPVPSDRIYDLEVGVDHLESAGLRLAWRFEPAAGLSITPRLTVLRTFASIEGSGRGAVRVVDGRYTGQARIDHRYTEDELLGRNVDGGKGWGATLDLLATYRLSDRLTVTLGIEDAVSSLRWDDQPRTTARIDSGSARLDGDGNLVVQPLVSGIETFDDHDQSLPRRIEAAGRWRFAAGRTLWVRHHQIAGERFNRVGLTLDRVPGAWSFGVDLDARAALFGWRGERLGVEVALDAFHPDDAGLVDVGVSLRL